LAAPIGSTDESTMRTFILVVAFDPASETNFARFEPFPEVTVSGASI
jgi:hypothetical protein